MNRQLDMKKNHAVDYKRKLRKQKKLLMKIRVMQQKLQKNKSN